MRRRWLAGALRCGACVSSRFPTVQVALELEKLLVCDDPDDRKIESVWGLGVSVTFALLTTKPRHFQRSCSFTDLRDTLLMLPPVQCRPRDPTGVLSLQEEGFGFAVLEAEDFAVAPDIQLSL